MTWFQIYAAYGAPALLVTACIGLSLVTRSKSARRFRKAQTFKKRNENEFVWNEHLGRLEAQIHLMQARIAVDRVVTQVSHHSRPKHRSHVLQQAKARQINRAVEAETSVDNFAGYARREATVGASE